MFGMPGGMQGGAMGGGMGENPIIGLLAKLFQQGRPQQGGWGAGGDPRNPAWGGTKGPVATIGQQPGLLRRLFSGMSGGMQQ